MSAPIPNSFVIVEKMVEWKERKNGSILDFDFDFDFVGGYVIARFLRDIVEMIFALNVL